MQPGPNAVYTSVLTDRDRLGAEHLLVILSGATCELSQDFLGMAVPKAQFHTSSNLLRKIKRLNWIMILPERLTNNHTASQPTQIMHGMV